MSGKATDKKAVEKKKRKKTKFSTEDRRYLKAIGKRIRQKREKMGLGSIAFSNLVKLSRMELHRIEKGEVSIPVTTLRRLAAKINTSVSQLLGD